MILIVQESAQLKLLLAEADAAQKARKKLELQTPSSVANISDINILEEWVKTNDS
jgi:urease gamma subunit